MSRWLCTHCFKYLGVQRYSCVLCVLFTFWTYIKRKHFLTGATTRACFRLLWLAYLWDLLLRHIASMERCFQDTPDSDHHDSASPPLRTLHVFHGRGRSRVPTGRSAHRISGTVAEVQQLHRSCLWESLRWSRSVCVCPPLCSRNRRQHHDTNFQPTLQWRLWYVVKETTKTQPHLGIVYTKNTSKTFTKMWTFCRTHFDFDRLVDSFLCHFHRLSRSLCATGFSVFKKNLAPN